MGQVGPFGGIHIEVEFIRNLCDAGLGTVITTGALFIHIAGGHLYGNVIVSRNPCNVLDLRHGIESDPGIVLDPSKIDFEAACRRT